MCTLLQGEKNVFLYIARKDSKLYENLTAIVRYKVNETSDYTIS